MRSVSRPGDSTSLESDFDMDPQSYIDKAVDKYAGNTFILNEKDPQTQLDTTKTFKIDRADALADNQRDNEIEEEYFANQELQKRF